MVEPVHLALIHAEIDGELDEHRRAELSRLLLSDPAVRALRDEMRRLCGALDALPQAEPPARLRADVIAALPQSQPARASASWSATRWRYAAVLAGVILTGTIVFRTHGLWSGNCDYRDGRHAGRTACRNHGGCGTTRRGAGFRAGEPGR